MTAAISSFIPPVAPQPPAQAPAPAQQATPERSFSQMLSQTQSKQAAGATASDPALGAPEARQETGVKDRPDVRNAERARAEKAGRHDQKPRTPSKAESREPTTEAPKADEAHETDATAKADGEPQADPALADWMAGLKLPPAQPEAGTTRKGADSDLEDAKATLDALAQDQAEGGRKGRPAGARDATDAGKAGREARAATELATRADAAESRTAAVAERAEAVPQGRFAQELQAVTSTHATGPAAAPARSAEAPAPTVVNVPTPATSPDFPQTLGVQVSVLARDGVQEAELHLNPAEMGPISVQIAIDGNQAQVNFGADMAATRQIIEQGLPELAAALRDAGFTLSGGGVHSQARGQGDERGEGRREGERSIGGVGGTETDVTPARTVHRVSAGGVDVYA